VTVTASNLALKLVRHVKGVFYFSKLMLILEAKFFVSLAHVNITTR